jgi:hypothetical protein
MMAGFGFEIVFRRKNGLIVIGFPPSSPPPKPRKTQPVAGAAAAQNSLVDADLFSDPERISRIGRLFTELAFAPSYTPAVEIERIERRIIGWVIIVDPNADKKKIILK